MSVRCERCGKKLPGFQVAMGMAFHCPHCNVEIIPKRTWIAVVLDMLYGLLLVSFSFMSDDLFPDLGTSLRLLIILAFFILLSAFYLPLFVRFRQYRAIE